MKNNTAKSPNDEQKLAIDHSGGKILSAGAGSGKTFVIIEHLINLLNEIRIKTPADQWSTKVPSALPRIVLMTFTKKAAGEMSIRMMNRLDLIIEDLDDDKIKGFWIIVRRYLSLMNITTISSFCMGLISQGHLPELGTSVEIVSRVEFKSKITRLFNNWFLTRENDLLQVFQANSNALISAMIEIFTSPELRLIWTLPLEKSSPEIELKPFVHNLYETLELNLLFENFDLTVDEKEKSKAWYGFLKVFNDCTLSYGKLSADNILEYIAFADNCGRLPSAVKSMAPNHLLALEKVKELVNYLRKSKDDLINFHDNFEIYWQWVLTFKSVFDYINSNYLTENGFDYSDLEYYVCTGLKNNEIRNKIYNQYDYFVVDEFQDTSSVQYEIIKSLIGDKKERLFCVGDRKQAIYGFRGGELLVFGQCSEMLGIDNNLWLKNNFRSNGTVIAFNNSFFEKIFPLGIGFEGNDKHSVTMEAQSIPIHSLKSGLVERIVVEVENVVDDKKVDLDFFEAQALSERISNLTERGEVESICVLYRKLKPSSALLEQLSAKGISFNAQIKIEYGEDPIINIFLRLIEAKINQNDSKKLSSTYFLLETLFTVLGLRLQADLIVTNFLSDLDLFGLRIAFHKTLFSLGISNSLYQENSKLIDSICKVCKDEPESVFQMLNHENNEQYSLEISRGNNKKKVVIMSAHASKGLEFDAVLLGGVHSNGNQMGKTETIGKMPKSFRWKKSYNQKKFFKSPAYYVEADLDKAKEFSESKRLLYVSCTRAIKYLGWVDLHWKKEGVLNKLSPGPNHWIRALRMGCDESLVVDYQIKYPNENKRSNYDLAFLLKDHLGILAKPQMSSLGIFAETSVTRLAELTLCPFKFYLSNICKITPPGKKEIFYGGDNENSDEIFYSSKERGTDIHQNLADLLTNKKVLDNMQKDKSMYQWVLSEAHKLNPETIISEKLIKFSLFGQMISGTPDIVFYSSSGLVIWDFKTGRRDEFSENSYWFQLICYGFAYANLKQFTPEKKVSLSLLYVDERKIIERSLSLEEMTEFLFEKWAKTESLSQVNKQHCPKCEYSLICQNNAITSP